MMLCILRTLQISPEPCPSGGDYYAATRRSRGCGMKDWSCSFFAMLTE